jgi:hypothetical protein
MMCDSLTRNVTQKMPLEGEIGLVKNWGLCVLQIHRFINKHNY